MREPGGHEGDTLGQRGGAMSGGTGRDGGTVLGGVLDGALHVSDASGLDDQIRGAAHTRLVTGHWLVLSRVATIATTISTATAAEKPRPEARSPHLAEAAPATTTGTEM